jgi:hypothetical protein
MELQTTIPTMSHARPHCLACGYKLHGLPEMSKCPECGSPAPVYSHLLLRILRTTEFILLAAGPFCAALLCLTLCSGWALYLFGAKPKILTPFMLLMNKVLFFGLFIFLFALPFAMLTSWLTARSVCRNAFAVGELPYTKPGQLMRRALPPTAPREWKWAKALIWINTIAFLGASAYLVLILCRLLIGFVLLVTRGFNTFSPLG